MNIFKLILCCFLYLGVCNSGAAHCSTQCLPSKTLDGSKENKDKIYIQPEQIHLSQEGIFIFDNEECLRIEQLNCDENGIYIFATELDKITDICMKMRRITFLSGKKHSYYDPQKSTYFRHCIPNFLCFILHILELSDG